MYILALLAAQWGNSTSPFHKFINSINSFELHFGSFWEKPNLSISVAHGHTSICPFSQIRRVEENKRCQLLVDHVYFALLAMLTGARTDAFLPRGLLFTTIEHNNKKIKTNSWGHFDKGHCCWTFLFLSICPCLQRYCWSVVLCIKWLPVGNTDSWANDYSSCSHALCYVTLFAV